MNRVSQIQFWDALIFVVRTFRCKNFWDAWIFVYLKNSCLWRFSLQKFIHPKKFWTQFEIVYCQGPCSLRLCISRPYCTYRPIVWIHDMTERLQMGQSYQNANAAPYIGAGAGGAHNLGVQKRGEAWFLLIGV